MNKKVAIILLNYCGTEDTLACIESLEKIDYKSFDIIIVDNDSPDDSYERLKKELEGGKHILIKAAGNDGFAKGNNIGIDYAMEAGYDYVLLLNNDTLVEENFLTELVRCYEEHENSGIVGAKILYEGKRNYIWYGGGEIDFKRFYGFHYGIEEEDTGLYDEEKEIDFITGCVMLIGREVIEKIGGLPEGYFMYFEDVDYCIRVKEAGYSLYYCPTSIVYHKVSAASGGEQSAFSIKWSTRNRIIFMDKFKGKISKQNYFKAKSFFYTTRIIRGFNYLLKGDLEKYKALKEGINMGRTSIKGWNKVKYQW